MPTDRHLPPYGARDVEFTTAMWAAPDSLPTHYRDNGSLCSYGGTMPDPATGRCPRGCDHADHYSNDGHEACEDVAP